LVSSDGKYDESAYADSTSSTVGIAMLPMAAEIDIEDDGLRNRSGSGSDAIRLRKEEK
jgi:hypothetical protein